MDKKIFVKKLAEKLNMKKVAAQMLLDDIVEILTDAIASDKIVTLMKLGSFKLKNRAARYCINPKTKERILIRPKKYVQFTASKKLIGKTKS